MSEQEKYEEIFSLIERFKNLFLKNIKHKKLAEFNNIELDKYRSFHFSLKFVKSVEYIKAKKPNKELAYSFL